MLFICICVSSWNATYIHITFGGAFNDVHAYKLNTFVVCRLAHTTDVYDVFDATIVQRVATRPRSSQSERRFLRVQRLAGGVVPAGILLLPLPGRLTTATQIQRLVNGRDRRQLHLVARWMRLKYIKWVIVSGSNISIVLQTQIFKVNSCINDL